jgi:hypothetical protein
MALVQHQSLPVPRDLRRIPVLTMTSTLMLKAKTTRKCRWIQPRLRLRSPLRRRIRPWLKPLSLDLHDLPSRSLTTAMPLLPCVRQSPAGRTKANDVRPSRPTGFSLQSSQVESTALCAKNGFSCGRTARTAHIHGCSIGPSASSAISVAWTRSPTLLLGIHTCLPSRRRLGRRATMILRRKMSLRLHLHLPIGHRLLSVPMDPVHQVAQS